MKKLISLLLALMMVMSLATVAFAAVEAPDGQYTATITKNYTTTAGAEDGTAPAVIPGETLTFTVTAAESNPDNSMISIGESNSLTVTGASNTIDIEFPTYTKTGTYNYTVVENAPVPATQGVGYSTTSFGVTVVVYYQLNEETKEQELVFDMAFTTPEGDDKIDEFNNTYDLGTLEVKKTVSGNLASVEQYFDFTVTFNAEKTVRTDITVSGGSHESNPTTIAKDWTGEKEVTFKLKADETLTFTNVPKDVTYTVVEDDAHEAEDANGSNSAAGYTVTGEVEEAAEIVVDETTTVTINNDKSTNIATGVITDSAPYILLIAVCAAAAVLFVIKRRNSVEF